MMSLETFLERTGRGSFYGLTYYESDLPCFANRITVDDKVNTPQLIDALVYHASNEVDVDVLVFSVTEQEKCWKAWASYAKANPRKFKVVQGGSIHDNYQCRMYIYTKPKSKRKYG